MRKSVFAIVLCLLAAAAEARCIAQYGAPGVQQATAGAVSTDATSIATTTDTQQGLPMNDDPPLPRESARKQKSSDPQGGGTGTAMVLAALAVMSGIALRHRGARMR